MGKPVFGVFNLVRHKACCIHVATKDCYILEILCKKMLSSWRGSNVNWGWWESATEYDKIVYAYTGFGWLVG